MRTLPVMCALLMVSCNGASKDSCVEIVPSTLLHEILCGQNEGPQGICLAEVDNGF